MIHQERRSYSRKTLNPLPYINLGLDNGGIVLDVSEQGLRFRATAPVKQSGPIYFSFSAHSDLVEGVADLVWTDQAKKTGGLRFTQLSDDAREMIRKWPHESDLRLSVGQDFMLHIPAPDESWPTGTQGRDRLDAILRFAGFWSKRFASTLRECFQLGQKEDLAASHAPRLVSHFKTRKRSFLGALTLMIGVILVSTLSYIRHREVGEWLVRLGTRISGEGHLQTTTQAPPSTLSMQPPGVAQMFGDNSKFGGTQEQAAPQSINAATPVISKGNASGPSLSQASTGNVQLSTPATPGRELVVQVAALTREADARQLADSLRQKNFQAFVRTLPADSLYRVMLGPYANMAAARIAVDTLKKAGFDSFIRRAPGAELSGSLRIATP